MIFGCSNPLGHTCQTEFRSGFASSAEGFLGYGPSPLRQSNVHVLIRTMQAVAAQPFAVCARVGAETWP